MKRVRRANPGADRGESVRPERAEVPATPIEPVTSIAAITVDDTIPNAWVPVAPVVSTRETAADVGASAPPAPRVNVAPSAPR